MKLANTNGECGIRFKIERQGSKTDLKNEILEHQRVLISMSLLELC